VGAVFRFAAEYKHKRQTNESILTAAGLITGSALLELILGVMILFGFEEHSLALFHEAPDATSLVGILGVGLLIYLNSLRRAEADQ
jgi:threonine/homoserine/homoserine lactone efflux protein